MKKKKSVEANAGIRAMGDLVDETMRLFQAFRRAEIRMHGEGDTTEAERNILFDLLSHGPRAVPALARERSVTRQRTQQVMNGLLAGGLTKRLPNPASEKSPLYDLSASGRKLVLAMLRKERRLYGDFARAVGPRRLRAAHSVLNEVRLEMERRFRE